MLLCIKKFLTFVLLFVNGIRMHIKHLRNKDIDYARWDENIAQCNNQLTYAYSWYLDVVSPGWEALVSDSYEFLMPLPRKRKYGIPYLVQPILTQQLGIFSKYPINKEIMHEFIKQIPNFSYELNLNEENFHPNVPAYPNYILDLNKSYQDLASRYSKNTQRNIEKAEKMGLKILKKLAVDDFLSFYYSVDKSFISPHQSIVKSLIEKGIEKKMMSLYGVYSSENKLIAGLCMMHSTNRLTYLLPTSDSEGKAKSAMFLLIDTIIREKAGTNTILDFEGSRIEGIARFYRGFGATNKPYYILKQFRPSFLIGK